jgi:hypothetical protein
MMLSLGGQLDRRGARLSVQSAVHSHGQSSALSFSIKAPSISPLPALSITPTQLITSTATMASSTIRSYLDQLFGKIAVDIIFIVLIALHLGRAKQLENRRRHLPIVMHYQGLAIVFSSITLFEFLFPWSELHEDLGEAEFVGKAWCQLALLGYHWAVRMTVLISGPICAYRAYEVWLLEAEWQFVAGKQLTRTRLGREELVRAAKETADDMEWKVVDGSEGLEILVERERA